MLSSQFEFKLLLWWAKRLDLQLYQLCIHYIWSSRCCRRLCLSFAMVGYKLSMLFEFYRKYNAPPHSLQSNVDF